MTERPPRPDRRESDSWTTDALKGYVDRAIADNYARLRDGLRAVEKHFDGLLVEKERATDLAAEEREKAAVALRQAMERIVQEGDDRLREHITNQVKQIQAALHSAELLELERIKAVADALAQHTARQVESIALAAKASLERSTAIESALENRIGGVRRELELVQRSSQDAVEKAEVATEKRFSSVNEWRGQSSDRERSMQEQNARLASTYMPREVADALFDDMRKQISLNTERINLSAGEGRGKISTRESILAAITVVVAVLAVLATVAVNALR